jgi:hypothetical protein
MHCRFLPMTTVVECVCACVCVWFVQTPLARLKRKKGDMHLGCVEQASFHRLPLLISNDLCDSWRSDRRCYWCQLTSLCVFVCACNVRAQSHALINTSTIARRQGSYTQHHQRAVHAQRAPASRRFDKRWRERGIRTRRCRRLTTKKGG